MTMRKIMLARVKVALKAMGYTGEIIETAHLQFAEGQPDYPLALRGANGILRPIRRTSDAVRWAQKIMDGEA